MKKVLNFSLALLAIVILSASCSKKDDPIPEPVVPITAVSVTPAVGAIDVKVDSKITITFSGKPSAALLNGAYAQLSVNGVGTKVPVTMLYDGNVTLAYTPKDVLLKGTAYTFNFEGASTSDGKTMLTVAIPFTTETAPFLVTAISPTAGELKVVMTKKITITFNKKPSDETIKGSFFSLLDFEGKPVEVTAAYDGANTMSYTPKFVLISHGAYTVTLDKATADDKSILSAKFSSLFETENIPFKLVSMTPVDQSTGVLVGAKVVLVFNKKLNTKVANGSEFILAGMNTPTSSTVTYDGDRTITLTPTALMKKNTVYTVMVSGLFATDGEKIADGNYGFTTEK